MKICNLCPLIDIKGSKCAIPGTQPCCSDCGCSLAFKLRAKEAYCTHPDGPKWTAETQDPNQNGSNIQSSEPQLRIFGS